jgi:hypothetical protein
MMTFKHGGRNTTYTSFDTITALPKASATHTTDSSDFAYIAAVKFFNVTCTGMAFVILHSFAFCLGGRRPHA